MISRIIKMYVRIIEVNVKVASDDEFVRGGNSEREEGMAVLKITVFSLESGDDEGGR